MSSPVFGGIFIWSIGWAYIRNLDMGKRHSLWWCLCTIEFLGSSKLSDMANGERIQQQDEIM
jgi:hypothetical protein